MSLFRYIALISREWARLDSFLLVIPTHSHPIEGSWVYCCIFDLHFPTYSEPLTHRIGLLYKSKWLANIGAALAMPSLYGSPSPRLQSSSSTAMIRYAHHLRTGSRIKADEYRVSLETSL